MIFPALFVLVVGVGMIAQWMASIINRQVPELQTEPIRIGFHLAGEMATALLLIVSGIGLMAVTPWAPTVFFVAAGMLLYTSLVSPGYFVQRGQRIWLFVFGVLIVLTLAAVVLVAART